MRTSFTSFTIYDFVRHRVIYSQWRLLKSLGYSVEECQDVSQKFFRKIAHPDDQRVVERHFRKITMSAPGQVLTCLMRIKDKRGEYRWIIIRDTAVRRSKDGKVLKLIGTIADISRFKLKKEQLLKSTGMMHSLSYRTSHELRAPVATALGLLTLMKYEPGMKDEQQEIIESLEKTIIKMDQVIREFGHSLHKTASLAGLN